MIKGLQNRTGQGRGGVFRFFILIVAFMVAFDFSIASSREEMGQGTDTSCIKTSASSQGVNNSQAPQRSLPCSASHHCHQHDCQTLVEVVSLVMPLNSFFLKGIVQERAPSSPFLDSNPRPPTV